MTRVAISLQFPPQAGWPVRLLGCNRVQEPKRSGQHQKNVCDLRYFKQNRKRVEQARMKLIQVWKYACYLKDMRKDTLSLRIRRQQMRQFTLEDMCRAALGSLANEWERYPYFYGALVLEFNERTQFLLQVCLSEP